MFRCQCSFRLVYRRLPPVLFPIVLGFASGCLLLLIKARGFLSSSVQDNYKGLCALSEALRVGSSTPPVRTARLLSGVICFGRIKHSTHDKGLYRWNIAQCFMLSVVQTAQSYRYIYNKGILTIHSARLACRFGSTIERMFSMCE